MTHLTFVRRLVSHSRSRSQPRSPSAQSVSQPELLFRAALHKQQVEGDLGAAITLYQKIVATRDAPRAVAARALLQLGDCYEKQGNEEARGTYERLVREFGDQSESVRLARSRLAAIAPSARARRNVTVRRLGEWPRVRHLSQRLSRRPLCRCQR